MCKSSRKSFLRAIPRPIDGAMIMSKNERDVDCTVTFQTESILERFMLRFDELNIDCNDRLLIYDGSHAIGGHRVGTNWIWSRGIKNTPWSILPILLPYSTAVVL